MAKFERLCIRWSDESPGQMFHWDINSRSAALSMKDLFVQADVFFLY